MDPSDSLQIDENLAKLLAAYDQSIDGADAKAPTIAVHRVASPALQIPALPATEQPVSSLSGSLANQGSLNEVLPDRPRSDSQWLPRPATTPAPAGTHRIGRFELRKQLGKGGCGIVFLAYDPKLEREVALKIPRPEMLLSVDARRRLIREALAAAEFDHPNLVPVYETGEIGPVCYIATAFCPGLTLGEWLDKQAFPVPVRQAARLLATVSEAIQHAHDRGVLHRDLKPNNVILQDIRDDPNLQEPPLGSCQLRHDHFIPRIVDFGLAKLLERGGPSETTTRQILGTPKYMAPEQAQARHDDVGPAVDVYGLGVMLYELLTGRAPYEGASDVEVLRQSIDGILTQPRQLRADIPRDLEAICLKAMARTPEKRFRTAIDLADDLRRFLDGKPTLARPLNWPGRAGRWLRRNDQAVALAVVTTVALMLLAFALMSGYQTRLLRSDREREQAERSRSDGHRQYARNVRDAYLAWRAGDNRAATIALDEAARRAKTAGESTDFTHGYLARLLAAQRLAIVCPAGPIASLAVSPDGEYLATGHANGTVALWRRATGAPITSSRAHPRGVTYLNFPRNGELDSADGGAVMSWTIINGELTSGKKARDRIPVATPTLPAVRYGNTLYTGGEDGLVRAWDSPVDEPLVSVESLPSPALALGISPDGSRFLVATGLSRLLPYSGTTRQQPLETVAGKVLALHSPRESPILALAIDEGTVVVSEVTLDSSRERFRYRPEDVRATSVAITSDGSKLAVGDSRGAITILNANDRSQLARFTIGEQSPIKNLAISPDGKSIAATVGKRVVLQGIQESAPRATFPADDATLVHFIPESNRLVVTRGTTILIVTVFSGLEEYPLWGHTGRVTGVAGSPDGRILVSGDINGEVKFWDLRTGLESMSFRRHFGSVTAVEFSAHGRLLVTGGLELAVWPSKE